MNDPLILSLAEDLSACQAMLINIQNTTELDPNTRELTVVVELLLTTVATLAGVTLANIETTREHGAYLHTAVTSMYRTNKSPFN